MNKENYFFKLYPNDVASPYAYDYELLELLNNDDIYKDLRIKFDTIKVFYFIKILKNKRSLIKI